MNTDIKHIMMEHTKRVSKFPYPIYSVGYFFNMEPVNYIENRFSKYIEFTIRLRGKGDHNPKANQTINNINYINSYPHALIKVPGEKNIYRDMPTKDVFYFTYSESMFEKLKDINLFSGDRCWNIEITPQIDFLIKQIIKCMNISQELGVSDRLDLYCFELLSEIILMRDNKQKSFDYIQDLVMKIDSYLRFHITETIDMNSVAAHFNLSKSTFYRYWKKYYDITPGEYFTDLKLTEACRRLERSNEQVNMISQTLKFRDTAYFCLIFRKKYGVTPLEYRKNKFQYQ